MWYLISLYVEVKVGEIKDKLTLGLVPFHSFTFIFLHRNPYSDDPPFFMAPQWSCHWTKQDELCALSAFVSLRYYQ
jgi:hypothetical protein